MTNDGWPVAHLSVRSGRVAGNLSEIVVQLVSLADVGGNRDKQAGSVRNTSWDGIQLQSQADIGRNKVEDATNSNMVRFQRRGGHNLLILTRG
jgi:hypothetical protein